MASKNSNAMYALRNFHRNNIWLSIKIPILMKIHISVELIIVIKNLNKDLVFVFIGNFAINNIKRKNFQNLYVKNSKKRKICRKFVKIKNRKY